MRIGILADIHANIVALEAVLDHAQSQNVERWICLGDVVGYGPEPGPCLERVRSLGCECVQGNHEAALLDLPTGHFNHIAAEAIEYSRQKLGPDHVECIRSFAAQIRLENSLLCVHGSPFDRDEYIFMRGQMRSALDYEEIWLIACGHTHQQYVFDGDLARAGAGEHTLDPARRYLLNPGSVGQPRDGDRRAAYMVLDPQERQLSMLRVDYDVEQVSQSIRDAGLPVYLAERLLVGR